MDMILCSFFVGAGSGTDSGCTMLGGGGGRGFSVVSVPVSETSSGGKLGVTGDYREPYQQSP